MYGLIWTLELLVVLITPPQAGVRWSQYCKVRKQKLMGLFFANVFFVKMSAI